jgi:hypothetical protein
MELSKKKSNTTSTGYAIKYKNPNSTISFKSSQQLPKTTRNTSIYLKQQNPLKILEITLWIGDFFEIAKIWSLSRLPK